jgi:hypothetical protein
MIDPAAKRQDEQWSSSINGNFVGICSILPVGPVTGVNAAFGDSGRDSTGGIRIVYRIAVQRQPPFKVMASEERNAIFDIGSLL